MATNATTAANANVTYIHSQDVAAPAGGGTVNNPSDTFGSVAICTPVTAGASTVVPVGPIAPPPAC